MNDPGHTLSGESVKAVARAVRFASRFSRETVNVTAGAQTLPPYTPATVTWHVKVTADPPGGSAELSTLYEGTAYMPDPGGSVAAPAWLTVTCWVRALPGQTLAVGDFALARLSGWRAADPGDSPYSARPIYELNATAVSLGCGLTRDEGGNLTLDYADIAGAGLSVDSSGDCDKLQVEPTTMVPSTGPKYGLTFIFVGGRYYLSAYIGCGLEFDATGAIAVDYEVLAGNNLDTGLVVLPPSGAGCPSLSNDYTPVSTTTETADAITGYVMDCCTLKIQYNRTTYTNHKNGAGELIDRTTAAPVASTLDIDFCKLVRCCFAATLTVTAIESDPVTPAPEVDVDFASTVRGGVGPFTYAWDFGDGDTGTGATPTHSYADSGEYVVRLAVTDTTCGCTTTATYVITVANGVWEQYAGTYTFTPEVTGDHIIIGIGGGGGGGESGDVSLTAGGGGGAYCRVVKNLTAFANHTVQVGSGGAPGTGGALPAGDTTFFDTDGTTIFLLATGGGPGTAVPNGADTVACIGDVKRLGGSGHTLGGGGSSGGTDLPGNPAPGGTGAPGVPGGCIRGCDAGEASSIGPPRHPSVPGGGGGGGPGVAIAGVGGTGYVKIIW
jgi:PKD repeat protein